MTKKQPDAPSLDLACQQQPFDPGTNNAALALALTNPEILVNGASSDLPPIEVREMRRRNLDADYEIRMRQILGDSLTRVYRHRDGVLLYFQEKGQIQDLGGRLVVQGGMEERLAAERIVAMGLERGWSTITFTGSPAFIEHAMRYALNVQMEVIAKGDEQAEILAKVMAEQKGGMGAMAGAAPQPLPAGAVAVDDDVLQILSELDELPPPQKLEAPRQPQVPRPDMPMPQPKTPVPAAPEAPATAPPPPVVGVFPRHINFKERLQERRLQRTHGNQPPTGPKVSKPAPPRA